MSRSAALAVAALLLTAGVAPAVAVDASTVTEAADSTTATGDATSITESSLGDDTASNRLTPEADTASNNTTRRLSLVGPATENYSSVELDFAATMAFSGDRVQSQYQTTLVAIQLEQLQAQSAREAVVDAYLDSIEDELESLSAAETAAVRQYETGEVDVRTLLLRFAMVDRRARAMEDSLDRLQRTDAPVPQRLRSIRMELEAFQSPIRQHVSGAATGELKGAVNEIHVAAATEGVVVEMLDDRRYYRNAIRFDNRAPDSVDQFDGNIDRFRSRIAELYPWSYQGSLRRNAEVDTHLARNLYRITYRHPQGSIAIYADGGTSDVAREQQELILDQLPKTGSTVAVMDNVTVSVTPTLGDAPVLVNVSRTASGNGSATPLDALVRVNDHTVGRTGEDGRIWLLPPNDGAYEVRVVQDGTVINVSVSS
ncbi:DUF7094 domain-containing protein [Halorubellus litoreus]|uniref:Uncharacterized protein n=1 Tax=Halorubellus litoreus TaxID=755308 RepID=A0ABD5VA36_9EURY